jgi:hypothetical protein
MCASLPVQAVLPAVCKICSLKLIVNGNRPEGRIRDRWKDGEEK